jgi:dolichyl-phosphate-mannose-protein mannosyltransferase
MSSSPSLRKRGGKKDTPAVSSNDGSAPVVASGKRNSEWDYWLAITILTVLAFATRFWRIDYPNEVVFDEVHFGKVRSLKLRDTIIFDEKGAWSS